MVKLQVSTAYIAASTNRSNRSAHISPNSTLVAFGSGRLVALWNIDDQNDSGVQETLPGHEGLVTCVRFLRDDFIVSADDKGAVWFWRKFEKQWRSTATIPAHQQPVSALVVSEGLLVTGSSDSSVKIWNITDERESHKVEEAQVISLQGRYPLALAVTTLPHSQAIILAIAGTDRNVNIWTRSEKSFVRSVTLPGHEDWVRALAFSPATLPAETAPHDPLVLASGSQDGTIRLWNINALAKPQVSKTFSDNGKKNRNILSDDLLDDFEASLADPTEGEEGGRQISLKRHILSVKSEDFGQQYAITFDALLIGHEAGVTSVAWAPSLPPLSGTTPPPQTLLSTSTDSSLILWSPSQTLRSASSKDASIWINRQRFGDVGGQRLGGFVGGLWARTTRGDEAMAWGWNGGWRRWRSVQASEGEAEIDQWKEVGAISGHNGPVGDLEWSPAGEYVISVGLDQTTRVHGAVISPAPTADSGKVWHELARPQVHGYDLVGATWLGPWTFASVADEKVARVFEAPQGFVETAKCLGVRDIVESSDDRPIGASVPPLGLSNKAISEAQLDSLRPDRRPFEGELAATTLWPETEKVFGHGYESITIASSNSHDLLATACRATSAQHAVVRVYSTSTYQPFGSPLEGHSLTVTRIAFSPDDNFIVTVSRDRTWRSFEKTNEGYVPVAADKSHARIIWDCSWSREGDVFATASRDKTVKIWSPKAGSDRWPALATLKFKEAATAVAFCSLDSKRRLLAVGLETGEILIHHGSRSAPEHWDLVHSIGRGIAHIAQIHRLAWRSTDDPTKKHLASCSEDGILKILIVQVDVN
ncbi:WD40 repeat-like protein [Paxillus ammoniavirescens]|nr:WD40 repeat-like protein [Paxillus ammoniavirescens]